VQTTSLDAVQAADRVGDIFRTSAFNTLPWASLAVQLTGDIQTHRLAIRHRSRGAARSSELGRGRIRFHGKLIDNWALLERPKLFNAQALGSHLGSQSCRATHQRADDRAPRGGDQRARDRPRKRPCVSGATGRAFSCRVPETRQDPRRGRPSRQAHHVDGIPRSRMTV
jgi:hypothetical protein